MRTNRKTAGSVSRLRTSGGYSLVEMMIAIGIALVVGLAVFSVFKGMQRGGQAQKIYNDAQTSCNFAMDQMKSELIRAGYRIPKHPDGNIYPISNAAQGTSTVTFEYYDDQARSEPGYTTGKTNATQVTYKKNINNELVREFRRFDGTTYPAPTTASDIAATTQVLAPNIAALSFSYFTGNGDPWDGVDPMTIRTIRPTLICNASRPNPDTGKTAQITLTAEVRARNVGVDSVSVDATPPAQPTGMVTWDPGQCGTLNLRWNANTEVDLAGYILFYGPTSTDFTTRQTIGRAPGTAGSYEYLTVINQDALTLGTEHYFAIEAYDKSGNLSPLSLAAHGNPSPSVRSVNPGSSDSYINTLAPPAAPTGLTATPGANSVTLNWTRSSAVGLKGYKLFRSDTGPDFTLIDEIPAALGNRIMDWTNLGPDTTSFTDTGLLGCQNYYYKLVAIDCVTNIPAANMIAASVTGVATDNVNPSTPTLTAKPGYRRIIFTLTNPVRELADSDFSHTKIWYSTVTYPTMDPATKVVSGGTLVPDSDPYPSPYGPGSFTSTGMIFPPPNFNSLTDGSPTYTAPSLPACYNQAAIDAAILSGGAMPDCDPITYYFTAVAFDQCQNASLVTAASQSQGTQCGDCALGEPCYNAPPAPSNLTPGGCSSVDGITVEWNDYDVDVYRDLAGFHIWRCAGMTCASGGTELTQGTPVWTNRIVNTNTGTYPVADGATYSYRIEAADCYYERRATVSPAERALNNPDDNSSTTSINNLSVGRVALDPTMSQLVTGYLLPEGATEQATLPATLPTIATRFTISADDKLTSVPPSFEHNAVTTWVRNSAASRLTLTQARLTWENPQAYLQQIAFGDGANTPMTRLGWRDTSVPLTTTSDNAVTMAANSQLLASDDHIPIVALFKNASGNVDRSIDARQQSLTYRLTYRNESTATDGCSVQGTSLYVPLGPYVYGTSQDQPADGTRAWPVPGDQGVNATDTVTLNAGSAVNVFTSVFDSSNAGVSAGAVRLYYIVTDALTAAPELSATAQYPVLPPYTAITMVNISGNQWRTPVGGGIPSSPGKSIWYFIVAIDNEGNFDREPEIDSGAFQYYQQQANVCASIPNPPTSLTGTTASDQVTLSWSAPLKNTDASDYLDGRGYKIYRRQDAGAWLYLATINDKTTTSYTDLVGSSIETSVYDYRVTALDMCTPTAKESAPSNTYTETAEAPCGNTPSAPVLSGTTDSTGVSVTLTWTRPTTNSSGTTLIDLAGYQIWKRIDSGAWAMLGTTPAGTENYTDGGLVDTGYRDHSYYVTAYDVCSTPAANVSVPSNVYVDGFTANTCDTTPGAVSNIHFTMVNSTIGVDLAWNAPTTQSDPVGWPYNDPGGYEIWRRKMNPDGSWAGEAGIVHTVVGTSTSWRDSSVAATVGAYMYDYWVRAFDTCSTRKYGDWVGPVRETYEYVDPCAAAPNAPTAPLIAAPADSSGVNLSWQPPAPLPNDLAGYVIERKNGATGTWAPIVGSPLYGGATSIKDAIFDAGKYPYFYRVKTIDTCGAGLESAYIEAQETYDYCTSLLPDKPTGLSVTAVDTSGVSLSWTAPNPLPDDLGGYEIERGVGTDTTAPSVWAPIAGSPRWGSSTTIKDSFATAGTAVYYYRVRAFDLCTATKYSPYSDPVKEPFTYDPCASLPVPTGPSSVSWQLLNGSSNACRNNSNNPVAVQAELFWTAAPAIPAGVTSRSYEVFACDTAGCTPSVATTFTVPVPGHGGNASEWSTTVTPGGFLADKPYTFGVRQVYSNGTCSTRSAMVTVTETCN